MAAHFDRTRLLSPALDGSIRTRRARALDTLEAALAAVEPQAATAACLAGMDVGDDPHVIAFGKASVPMARAALAVGARRGIVLVLRPVALDPLEVRLAAHPHPAADAERTGLDVLSRAEGLGPLDTALCLVSGGGSAMLELPRAGLSLAELSRWTSALARAGADIAELNAVRRCLSRLKGGGLASALAPARVLNVVISDVPGMPPEIVASGPTCAPPPVSPDAEDVARRYGVWSELTPSARRWLKREPLGLATPPTVVVAAENDLARRATGLRDRGLLLQGEARELGARIAREAIDDWVAGGETTVAVRGSGRGGRSLELALGALAAGWREGLLLAAGTDGIDGNSDLAGALIDPAVVAEARRLGLAPDRFLDANDAAAFFEQAGGALRCGPTETNVADLCLALR